MVSIAEDSVLGVVFSVGKIKALTVHQLLVFFRKVSLGHGSALSFFISVDSLFEPVRNESTFA